MLNRNNIEYEFDKIVDSVNIVDYNFEIGVTATSFLKEPTMELSIHDKVIYSGSLKDGEHKFVKKIKADVDSSVIIKAKTDDHIHKQKIVKDRLVINGVNIFKTNLWVLDNQKFTHTDGKIEMKNNGLYHNGTWSLELPTPIFPWMRKNSNKKAKGIYKDHFRADGMSDDYYKLLDKIFR